MSGGRSGGAPRADDRGQLVLLAAATVAVALVAMGLAYAQLGYDADATAGADARGPGASVDRALDRAVHGAAAPAAGEYRWARRTDAAAAVGRRLDRRVGRIERARLDGETVVRVERNGSAARRWARRRCPGGPERRFGACRAVDGVVVQERAGETTVLAVALDVRLIADGGRLRSTATTVYRAAGRR